MNEKQKRKTYAHICILAQRLGIADKMPYLPHGKNIDTVAEQFADFDAQAIRDNAVRDILLDGFMRISIEQMDNREQKERLRALADSVAYDSSAVNAGIERALKDM